MVVEAQPAQWRQETHSLIRSETGSLAGTHLLATDLNVGDQEKYYSYKKTNFWVGFGGICRLEINVSNAVCQPNNLNLIKLPKFNLE